MNAELAGRVLCIVCIGNAMLCRHFISPLKSSLQINAIQHTADFENQYKGPVAVQVSSLCTLVRSSLASSTSLHNKFCPTSVCTAYRATILYTILQYLHFVDNTYTVHAGIRTNVVSVITVNSNSYHRAKCDSHVASG